LFFVEEREQVGANGKNNKRGEDDNINYINVTLSHDLLVVCDNNMINVAHHIEISWVVDSGAFFHVTSKNEVFLIICFE
jgi:hypothetical protein